MPSGRPRGGAPSFWRHGRAQRTSPCRPLNLDFLCGNSAWTIWDDPDSQREESGTTPQYEYFQFGNFDGAGTGGGLRPVARGAHQVPTRAPRAARACASAWRAFKVPALSRCKHPGAGHTQLRRPAGSAVPTRPRRGLVPRRPLIWPGSSPHVARSPRLGHAPLGAHWHTASARSKFVII
jgi:hypothetical protein